MKEYINRIMSSCKKWELVYWWILRLLMIFAMIKGFTAVPFVASDPLQVFANLVGMFAWEIFMLFPEKTFVRHFSSKIQNFSALMIFAGSFCGRFLNFYYDVRFWDSAMHLTSGALCVLLGYEVVATMQKRDLKVTSVPIALLCALGFSFFVSTCWELFEFTADEVMCFTANGDIMKAGDAQHWCWALAEGTKKASTFIPAVFTERWPIMDTMQDIVLNSIGAIVAWVVLKIKPYNHTGKNDVNQYVENQLKSKKAKVTK